MVAPSPSVMAVCLDLSMAHLSLTHHSLPFWACTPPKIDLSPSTERFIQYFLSILHIKSVHADYELRELGFLNSQMVLTHQINIILLPLVYDVNNLPQISSALLLFFNGKYNL